MAIEHVFNWLKNDLFLRLEFWFLVWKTNRKVQCKPSAVDTSLQYPGDSRTHRRKLILSLKPFGVNQQASASAVDINVQFVGVNT